MKQRLLFFVLCLASAPSFACSLARWSAVENDSGILTVVEDSAHFEADCGMRVSLAGATKAHVEDNTPGRLLPAMGEYLAQFNLNLDEANLSAGDTIELFTAYDADNSPLWSLSVTKRDGELRTFVQATDSEGQLFDTDEHGVVLTPGWHSIGLTWRASSIDEAYDGELLLEVDGMAASCNAMIAGLDNDLQKLAATRLGVLSGNAASVSGQLDVDSFIARRIGFAQSQDCRVSVDSYVLPNNQWRLITLPVNPGNANTVLDIFGDDLPAADYGATWALFSYDGQATQYVNPGIDGGLKMGRGYWLIQFTGASVSIDIDEFRAASPVGFDTAMDTPNAVGWNLSGFPRSVDSNWDQIKVLTESGVCQTPAGCSLATALAESLFHNQGWIYNGTDYVLLEGSAVLNPWSGFWCATLSAAQGTSLKLAAPPN